MTALTTNKSRRITGGNQGSRGPLLVNAVPFMGSLLSRDTATGFLKALAAGEIFAGISIRRVEAADWKPSGAASGDIMADYISGRGWLVVDLTVTQADAINRRKVYASDDNTFTFTPTDNTYIGEIVEIISTSSCIVEFTTDEQLDAAPGIRGIETLPDAPTTLTLKQANKLLRAPVSAARAYTLPAAASWVGKYFTVVNVGGAFAVTLTAAAGEKIGGAATLAQAATVGRSSVLYSTGIAGAEIEIISNQ